eukprot:1081248-Rhodomonas_salina.1
MQTTSSTLAVGIPTVDPSLRRRRPGPGDCCYSICRQCRPVPGMLRLVLCHCNTTPSLRWPRLAGFNGAGTRVLSAIQKQNKTKQNQGQPRLEGTPGRGRGPLAIHRRVLGYPCMDSSGN